MFDILVVVDDAADIAGCGDDDVVVVIIMSVRLRVLRDWL